MQGEGEGQTAQPYRAYGASFAVANMVCLDVEGNVETCDACLTEPQASSCLVLGCGEGDVDAQTRICCSFTLLPRNSLLQHPKTVTTMQ
jgi:hypothetical protein